MSYTRAEQEAFTLQACGLSLEELERHFSVKYDTKLKDFVVSGSRIMESPEEVAASLMSDAQEEIALGLQEKARQTLNRAKHVLFEARSLKRNMQREGKL